MFHKKLASAFVILFLMTTVCLHAQDTSKQFNWPEGKKFAISLSFDDARQSQVDVGTAVLDQYQVKVTFYVVPAAVESRLEGWKKAVSSGHEIGNHSVKHPCTENFAWSRNRALENYSIKQMREELAECNKQVNALLGVTCRNFAYPCGQKFVGRGEDTKSYVPVIAKMFTTGRGWMDEAPNDPLYCNPAQLSCYEMDGKDFDQILPLIEAARKSGSWLVLGGHEIGENGMQTTRIEMLRKLMAYAQDPANGVWLQPIGTVADYVLQVRK